MSSTKDSRSASTGGAHRDAARAHWAEIARRWAQLGPPLRPAPQDVAFYAATVEDWMREQAGEAERPHASSGPRMLVLGVTPELCRLPSSPPPGAHVLAIDHAPAMIHAVWPGQAASRSHPAVVCGDWAALPLPDASRDVVFCDGGLLLLPYPDGLRAVARALARVVAPGGRCAFRLFIPPPPAERETVDAVFRDLFAGRIANLNLLKVRLWMALHADPAEGLPLRRVWDVIHDAAPDFHDLAARLDWPVEHLLAINAYRDSSACYHLLTVDEVCRIFCGDSGGPFARTNVCVPNYELGASCPTVVLRRNDDTSPL
jgi:SAM-dependent methyltransferase